MNTITPGDIANFTTYTFNFTFTLKNQVIDFNTIDANYILDTSGLIFIRNASTSNTATIAVVGGVDSFTFEKEQRAPTNFYISDAQKIVIYRLIREISFNTDTATLSANQDNLQIFLQSLYNNYCG